MTPAFEILANLCLGAICAEHVLPVPAPMTQAQCVAKSSDAVAKWLEGHPEYRAKEQRCAPTYTLADKAAKVVETAPGHFVHFGKVEEVVAGSDGDIANTGFIIGADAVAVIDSGSTRFNGEALYLAVRQHTDLPIRWMVLTHMHPDHILGADVFAQAGATIIGSDKLEAAIGMRAVSYIGNMQRLLGDAVVHGTKVALPTQTISGQGEIDLGGRSLTLTTYQTAHTNNDLTVFDTQSATLWTGDLAFLQHVPALDGSINGWITVLEQLSDTETNPVPTAIIPGHGQLVADHPEGLQPTLTYLKALRGEVREALEAGETLGFAASHVGANLRGDWQMFDAFNPRNATNAYVELEWE